MISKGGPCNPRGGSKMVISCVGFGRGRGGWLRVLVGHQSLPASMLGKHKMVLRAQKSIPCS